MVNNSIDVMTLQPYSEITGSLTFNAAGIGAVSLPNLCKVDGGIIGTVTGCTTFEMPSLQSTGGFNLTGLNVPMLSFPSLTSPGSSVSIANTGGLSMPLVTTLGQLHVYGATSLDFGSLQTVTILLDFEPPGGPTVVHFEALTTIGTTTSGGAIIIASGGAWSFPALQTILENPNALASLYIKGPVTSFDAPKLTTASILQIDQVLLQQLSLPAVQKLNELYLGPMASSMCSTSTMPNLSSLKMPSLMHYSGYYGGISVTTSVPALPQACIDTIAAQTGMAPWAQCAGSMMPPCNCPAAAGPCL